MPERHRIQGDKPSVQRYARAAGLLYLIIIVLGVVGEAVIRSSLIVWGDPAATAQRILDAAPLWRMGIAGQIILLVCAVMLTAIWYVLLRPVNRHLALALVCFGLVSLAVESFCALHLQAALTPLTSPALLKVATQQQLQLSTYLAVVAHAETFGLALIFFGVQCLLVGHLVRKSGYFPRALGVMMQIVGVCYLINSFTMFLHPPLQRVLFPAILLPAFIGESAMCLWLLIKGVDVTTWYEKAVSRPASEIREAA
jgi:cbb3-type cytochrome oxidase subunit 3